MIFAFLYEPYCTVVKKEKQDGKVSHFLCPNHSGPVFSSYCWCASPLCLPPDIYFICKSLRLCRSVTTTYCHDLPILHTFRSTKTSCQKCSSGLCRFLRFIFSLWLGPFDFGTENKTASQGTVTATRFCL